MLIWGPWNCDIALTGDRCVSSIAFWRSPLRRALSKRFPFGVYYLMEDEVIRIYAVLDLRRDPAWIRRRLTTGER